MRTKYEFYQIITAPGLQFLTMVNQQIFKSKNPQDFRFADSSIYWNFLKNGYLALNTFYDQFYSITRQIKEGNVRYESKLLIDCANGIASHEVLKIKEIFSDLNKVTFINTNHIDCKTINENCGAEHVHKERKLPLNFPEAAP